MAWSQTSGRKPKGKPKTVRKTLADGSTRIYTYERKPAAAAPRSADSIAAMTEAYQRSPEWARLSDTRKLVCTLYLRRLRRLGAYPATALRRRDIRTIRDEIAAAGKPGAANMFVAVTRAMFTWGVKNDWVENNPAMAIEAIKGGRLPPWSQVQADQAIAELPEHLRRLVLVALYTGQRRGDLTRLAWSNYDGTRIKIVQGKTQTALTIPVHPVLKEAMDTWPKVAATVLVNARGRPWHPDSVSEGMRYALDKIGFPKGFGVHGLRKLAAANLAEAGCSTLEIASITGHKSLAMLSLYTASADQERMATAAIIRLQRK